MSHARENRGLQVALIVFTVIGVVLGVTTFVFFRRYDEAARRAAAAAEQARQNLLAARLKQDKLNELKGVIGVPVAARVGDIRRQHVEDLAGCAANLPPECRSYRQVIAHLDRVIRERNAQLIREKQLNQQLNQRIVTLDARNGRQLAEFERAAAQALEELAAQQERHRDSEAVVRKDNRQLHQRTQNARQRADSEIAEARREMVDLAEKLQTARRRVIVLENDKKRRERTDWTEPAGRIRHVNLRLRTAWIDLGRADGLPPHTGFDVYPAAAARLHPGNVKGEIEVTRLLGEHLAEAAVVEDEITDPIIGGDQIQTAKWERKPTAIDP